MQQTPVCFSTSIICTIGDNFLVYYPSIIIIVVINYYEPGRTFTAGKEYGNTILSERVA